MDKTDILKLANQIVELDQKRDEAWEKFLTITGVHAHEVLRKIQNSEIYVKD